MVSTKNTSKKLTETQVCPLCSESHSELVALLAQGQLRRTPSRDLIDELEHVERELVEIKGGTITDVELGSYFSHRHDALKGELRRRNRLAKMGGPKVGQNHRIPDEVIRAIKDACNLDDLAWQLGVAVFGNPTAARRPMCCPLPGHADEHPSAVLYATEGRWWCHRCNQGGDAFDLVMAVRGCPWREAAEWLREYARC